MFAHEVPIQIFSNVESIYQLHRDDLLPQLNSRLAEWDSTPKIGDIMKKFAPFLKLYTQYIQNYANATSLLEYWLDRSREFSNLVEQLQKLPECGKMELKHHLLEPVQRVPKYLMLLKEYMKHMTNDSQDKEDIQCAYDLVSKAEIFRQLININKRLGHMISDVITPNRRFIREGVMMRIHHSTGLAAKRYLFLFNDMLLVCQPAKLSTLSSREMYSLKRRINLADLKIVEDAHNLLIPGTFYLSTIDKNIELLASQSILCSQAFNTAIESCQKSSASPSVATKTSSPQSNMSSSDHYQLPTDELGRRAPQWVKDSEVSMCMRCAEGFNIFNRKKHCRSCGHTKAKDKHIMCGYMKTSCDLKNWQNYYFIVCSDFVLYAFKAHKDVKSFSSLPIPGYTISSRLSQQNTIGSISSSSIGSSSSSSNSINSSNSSIVFGGSGSGGGGVSDCGANASKIFVITHKDQSTPHYFLVENHDILERWVDVLSSLSRTDLPKHYESQCLNVNMCPAASFSQLSPIIT
ncbi:hypothetical protein HELRODRAFT_175718 [Helobdella robusta]|uniref:Uncharacterized protein n=1 Tax=Helobdella robusta TaxID=6412 RepID=T1F9K1_HELRO|nr:hypothetical protein HELRODRAFT_175718 [Helobdella robusta]ESO00727.1 hypothetical protein HELRODRAFT_175718 [Helobdella robusta]